VALLAAVVAIAGYAALAFGARLLPTLYAAVAAATGIALLLAQLPGSH